MGKKESEAEFWEYRKLCPILHSYHRLQIVMVYPQLEKQPDMFILLFLPSKSIIISNRNLLAQPNNWLQSLAKQALLGQSSNL